MQVFSCLEARDIPDISVTVFDKDLRPMTLTSILSNIVEAFVINKSLKPTVLLSTDPKKYEITPGPLIIHDLTAFC